MRTRWPQLTLALGLVASLATAGACSQKDQDASQPGGTDNAAVTPKADPAATGATQPIQNRNPEIEPPLPVAAPPESATKTDSGLAFQIVTASADGAKPNINDTVRLHYTSWTPDGKTFFSTKHRERPQRRYIPQQAPGWSETILDMRAGEKRMVWMPPDLAYSGRGPKPTHTMAMAIELVEIQPAPPIPENVAAPPADAAKTKSGIHYKELTPGTGSQKPRDFDQVLVHLTGWTQDGLMIQTTRQYKRERPRKINLLRAVPGWREVLSMMVPGQKIRAWIPGKLASRRKSDEEREFLVYEFELLSITEKPTPPETPPDVAKPPANAKKTRAGVFYRVLKPGTGKEHPDPRSVVKVHYTGWTTDGEMFDSSVTRGKPASFTLDRVIPGWTDGLQTMVTGEHTRFWIPEKLAYQGKPNTPQGMLVFDVELIEFRSVAMPDGEVDHPEIPEHGDGDGAKPSGAKPAPAPGAKPSGAAAGGR